MHSLDGLRGVASAIVLIHHVSLIVLPVATGSAGPVWWLITQSPLSVLFAGHESVIVFFVLSGLVVTLPLMKPSSDLVAYYPSRVLRLYLPVWGALALAAALVLIVPRDLAQVADDSWLATTNALSVDPGELLRQASLTSAQYDLSNPLWSLRWEMLYSLLAPLFMVAARACRRWVWPAGAAAVAIVLVGQLIGNSYLIYLPPFFIGALIAVSLPRVLELRTAEHRPSTATWAWLLTGSIALLMLRTLFSPLVEDGEPVAAALSALIPAGAAGVVLCVLAWPGADRLLARAVPQWLGRISFSLYLIHVPILVTLAFALGDAAWPAIMLIGVPLCLLAAEVFERVVEKPSHRLSRSVRRRIVERRH
ncbi:acyltransferase family protein [Mycetocola reblochoni]|uniref:acyltransferase family protein n=1 Tax=Mycetocola reblochoni TaxID=331618 RepID=UPI0023EA7672|nr:acyltransferase [Mycetocola reblochoni]